ncbi:DNA internalization-related competence protein ComEC/Rec2 [candidate division WOR-3 bacterium]|nr:DNA internalization-related competence protein ComEC/Rec2 [candidate division WOR-3 bacterium]
MRRPALKTTLAFSSGIIIGYFTKFLLIWSSLLLIGVCTFYLITGLIQKREKTLNFIIFFIIAISGMFWYDLQTTLFSYNNIKNCPTFKENIALISKIIADPDIRINQTILECEAESLITSQSIKSVSGKVRISVKFPTSRFKYGDRIEVYGKLRLPEFSRNPDAFDYRAWLKRRNIYRTISVWKPADIIVISEGAGNPIISRFALPMKRFIRNTIDNYLSGNQAGFLKAIVIGQRGMLPKKVHQYFQNTGVVHIMAVSGLHVGILAAILFLLFRVFRIPLLITQILTSFFLIIYVLMIPRYSAVRATIMIILGMIALTSERDADILNTISCAALLILFLNPQAFFDVGFQLSFVAVLSIIYLYPKIYHLLFGGLKTESRIVKYFTGLFVISFCAQLGLMPLIAYYFFRVPVISIIANLFVIPLAGVSIALTFIMSIFNLLPLKIFANISASAAFGTTTFTLKLVELFSRIPYSHFWVGKPSVLFIGFSYLLLISGANSHISKKAMKTFLYGLLIGLNVIIWVKVYKITNPELKVTYLDVGHGDCIFVEWAEIHTVLNDGGPRDRCYPERSDGPGFNAGENIVAPFLRAKGISTLDFIMVSNPKLYRIGGLGYITDNFKVKRFVCPNIPYPSWSWLELLKKVKQKKIFCQVHKKNFILRVEYGNISFLFTGDVASPIELGQTEKSTIVSVPKHGNKSHFSEKWISFIAPEVAVISCGRNIYGEPSPEIIENYRTSGTKVLRTDKEGAITIRTDGKTYEIETVKNLIRHKSLKHRFLRYAGLL